jgi:hypothetical protein
MSASFLFVQDAQVYGSRVYSIVINVSATDKFGDSVSQDVSGIIITVPANSTAMTGCVKGNKNPPPGRKLLF